jgi:hypothetical protein
MEIAREKEATSFFSLVVGILKFPPKALSLLCSANAKTLKHNKTLNSYLKELKTKGACVHINQQAAAV